MPAIPEEIRADHVRQAIEAFDAGVDHDFGESREYDLLLDGKRYPVGSKNCAPCKGGDFQWVQFPPGDESLQPEAVGAAEEVTNPSKPLM